MRFYVARAGAEIGEYESAEFEEKIRAGEILPTDHFWAEGMAGWLLISQFGREKNRPRKRLPRTTRTGKPVPLIPPTPKPKPLALEPPARLERAASMGAACALLAFVGPLLWPGLILLSFPLLILAFALALLAIRQGRITAGITVLIFSILATPTAWKMFTDRDRMLSASGRQQIFRELREHYQPDESSSQAK